MRCLFLLLTLSIPCAVVHAQHNQLTPEQIADGWISLFDGKTLFGWQQVNDADWQVVDGEIRASTGEVGYLMTTSEFADYELSIEFKSPPQTNSGIFLRTPLEPSDPARDCVEVNIAPSSNPFPTGNLVKRDRSARNVSLLGPSKPEQWHTFLLQVQGTSIKVHYDGKPYLSGGSGPVPSRGHIGLQFNTGEIAFRNIRLKPLSTKLIFNGKDLTGWNTDRAEASEFKVTPDGELQVLNGRGQIESEASYGDFLLQLECFVNGEALNSGVFFRCIPGDFMMGYECQIQNGMKEGDPTEPVDCGTGGFFRRQNARRIVAKDREWFAMTLLADGPHMAAWVNGHQVSDWTDTRKPHENPRKGLRTEPGTLAIQGHDPTTDLRFRNLRAVELPSDE